MPIEHWRTGKVLGVEEIIERTEYVLAGRFARISDVATLTGS